MRHEKINSKILFLVLVGLFIVTRLYMHDYLNDWVDYDGACYHLDALHLLEGYVPYKDFILVHPLPFILFLAFFIKFFNLSFLDMFYVTYILNFIGFIFIYKIGKLLKNEYFGLFLGLVYILDPIILTFGKRLFMESSLISLMLASIYYFLKYSFEKENKYAYLSFFILGIALSIKMTMLPMLFVYLVFLFIISQKHDLLTEIYNSYIKNIPKIFLKSLVVYLIILFFFEMMSLINGCEVFIPVITFIDVINYSNYLGMLIFIYIFIIFSAYALINRFKISKIYIKLILTCFLIGMIPKFVEFIVGYLIGGYNYIDQCYLIQVGREGMAPFVIFNILSQLLNGLLSVNWGTIHGWGFIITIASYALLIKLFIKRNSSLDYASKLLFTFFVISLIFYNIFPTLPSMRYILPVYLLFLITFPYWMWNNFSNVKYRYFIIFSFCMLLSLNSFICYVEGEKTGFYYDTVIKPNFENSIPLYNKLYSFLASEHISNEKIFSTSPVSTAYLNLNTTAKYVDTFAPFFMYKISPKKLISELKSKHTHYVMITPWFWKFKSNGNEISKTIMLNYTLKYEVGDNIENILLYELKENPNKYTFYVSKNGDLIITNFNDTIIGIRLYAEEYELINLEDNTYILKYNTSTNHNKTVFIKTFKNRLMLSANSTITVPITNPAIINGNITYLGKKCLYQLKNVSYIVWYNNNKINLSGNITGVLNNSNLIIHNPKNLSFNLG